MPTRCMQFPRLQRSRVPASLAVALVLLVFGGAGSASAGDAGRKEDPHMRQPEAGASRLLHGLKSLQLSTRPLTLKDIANTLSLDSGKCQSKSAEVLYCAEVSYLSQAGISHGISVRRYEVNGVLTVDLSIGLDTENGCLSIATLQAGLNAARFERQVTVHKDAQGSAFLGERLVQRTSTSFIVVSQHKRGCFNVIRFSQRFDTGAAR